jgi:hypothetical protein
MEDFTLSKLSPVTRLVQLGLLLLALPVAAQVRVGELSTNLSGDLAVGYTDEYGNMTSASHSWLVGGAANLSGSFHNPNFLSFNVGLYLNQSRANSNFQSISNASGINVSSSIFGGSYFPGSITYSKAYNSEGNYAIPGIANYVTHGDNDAFGANWSENVPGKPSFSLGYQMGNSHYSVYGTNDQGNNTFHSLNLQSAYRMAGFNMGAYYSLGGGHSLIPQVVTGQPETEEHSDNSAFGLNVSHNLPLQGSFIAGFNRSSWDSDYLGSRTSGTIDMVNSVASMRPASKLSLSASMNYSDNLTGQVIQSIIGVGGIVPGLNSNQSSDSLDLMGIANYTPLPYLQTTAFAEHRTQSYLGETYGVQSYGGGATYSRELLAGSFNATMTAADNVADNSGQNTLGFSTTENYSSEFRGWHVNGSFGYAQNVQTLLVTYMNSYFNYSGNVRRRWGNLSLTAGAGSARTGLTQEPGTENSSQTYNASLSYGVWLTGTGSYSKANGQALATGAGLVPVPVPSPILPSNLVSLFGGESYSVGLSSNPVKNLILTANYAKSDSNTSFGGVASTNHNNQSNALVQYHVRKLYLNGGYARLEQGFSTSGKPPEVISSYYFGVSRWFNFF